MPIHKRPKLLNSGFKKLTVAMLSALLMSQAGAAGLGKLTVLSALGQPLRAEIELTSISKDEAGLLVPKLASAAAYRQANIEMAPALFTLRFSIDQRAGKPIIRVSSTQAINEPFVDMLLELGGGGTRLVREYTFLLDPADLRTSQSIQVAPTEIPTARSTPAVIPVPTERPARASRAARASAEATEKPVKRAAAPSESTAAGTAAGEYQVKRGDSLSKIAGKVKPDGVSLDQMLVALYRANPDAFLGNNMNRLRAGQILAVPDQNAVAAIDNTEAHNVIIAQATDFNSYRGKLAGQVASAAPQKSDDGRQSGGGKITARVEEKSNAASDSKDKLKVLNSETAAAAGAKNAKGPVGAEDAIAQNRAVADANARVKELEKNLNDLQKVLEIKNKELADRQKPVAPTPAVADNSSATAPTPAATPANPPAAPVPAASAPTTTDPKLTTPPVTGETKNDTPAVTPATPVVTESTPPAPAAVAKPKPAAAPVVAETGILDNLYSNPYALSGAAALLLLLGGYALYSARRRRDTRSFEDSILSDSSLKANSLFGSTGGQSVDTNNSVFNSNFAPSVGQLDTNEVDPVAEADVYIAYGRDAQAEEILKEALRTQPDRNAVRVKLLEIYSNRKDTRSFEMMASELYSMTKGQGDDWAQAAALGIALDPNNALYALGKPVEHPVEPMPMLNPSTEALDDSHDLDALLATTQLDPSLDSLNTMQESAYFGNTVVEAEVPEVMSEPVLPMSQPQSQPADSMPSASSDLLDFDLEGMSQPSMPTPASDPVVDIDDSADKLSASQHSMQDVNFDFLHSEENHLTTPTETLAPAPTLHTDADEIPELATEFDAGAAHEFSADEPATAVPELSMDAGTESHHPVMADDSIQATTEIKPAPLDFDLSGIDLDLNSDASTGSTYPDNVTSIDSASGAYANQAEMSTKLDLAAAYQEIGDKEGARELLDEVVKAGMPEQVEKAKSLLVRLA